MKKKVKTRSKTVQIIASATCTREALDIAVHGRIRLQIERMVDNYYHFSGDKLPHTLRANLAEMLLQAVDARDWTSLQAATDAVKYSVLRPNEGDSYRANLLALKGVLDDCGQSITIERLARLLALPNTEDGFSSLRRNCKQLRLPIKPGKRGPKPQLKT